MSADNLPKPKRHRLNSRRKRHARRDEYAEWFIGRCVDHAWARGQRSAIMCSPDFDGDIIREDGSVNWAAAFAAP